MLIRVLIVLGVIPGTVFAKDIQAGSYKVYTEVPEFEMSSASKKMVGTIKKPSTDNQCITTQMAKEGPLSLLRAHDKCEFIRNEVTDSKFNIKMSCPSKDGPSVIISAFGVYTSNHVEIDSITDRAGKDPMHIWTKSVADRVGDCKSESPKR